MTARNPDQPVARGFLTGLSLPCGLDLFYGDECGVCLELCVPYAWQFADEEVSMPASKGGSLNCFALLSRDNHCLV